METINNILDHRIWDNSVQTWVVTFIIIGVVYVLKGFLSRKIARMITLFFNKKFQTYSDQFFKNVLAPFELFIFWFITLIIVDKLQYPRALDFNIFRNLSLKKLLDILSQSFLIITFFKLLIGVNYFIGYIIKQNSDKINNRSANQAMTLVFDIIKVLLIVVAIFILLKICFNYNVSSLLTSLGLVTAALALAAKETVENMISSFIILFDKPFLTGDFVKGNGIAGNIEKIGVRSTRIRTVDKTLISIPNSVLIGGALENVSYQTRRRYNATLELAVETDDKKLQQFVIKIREIIAQQENILPETIAVYLTQVIGQSAHILMEYLTNMTLSLNEFRALNERVNLMVLQAARELEIDFNNNTSLKVTNTNKKETDKPENSIEI